MANAKSFLFPFKYSNKVVYVVEFSHEKIRLFAKKKLVTELGVGEDVDYSNASPIVIDSPYTFGDLWNGEELCCKIQTIQHCDVMYIFSENHPIKVLKRYSNMDWRLEDLELKNGPFNGVNTGDILVRCGDSLEGDVELIASDELFVETDVNRLMRFRVYDDDTKPWVANISVSKGDIYYSDNKYYEAFNDGTTGAVKPVHSEGYRSDGSVKWKYLHDGTAVVRITEFVDATNVKGVACSRLPDALKEGTLYWEQGLISSANKYPVSGAFFRNRFAFLINTDTGPMVCFSCSGDYNNFSDMEFREATAETAITVPVLNTEFNEGKWLYAGDVLFVGTGSAEFYIDVISAASPMANDNVKILQISSIGSKAIMPVGVGKHVFFAEKYGQGIRDLVYNYYNEGYDQIDISLLGKHLFQSRIVAMSYQEVPDKLLWFLMGDGNLVTMTFSADQEVAALSRHDVSGFVESLVVVPNYDECCDELWLEVRRIINNKTSRMVEVMENGMPIILTDNIYSVSDIDKRKIEEANYVLYHAMYLDAAVLYERKYGDDTTVINGLEHLEGMVVNVFADGAILPQYVVIGGQIDLRKKYYRVLVGLGIKSQYIPQNIFIPNNVGVGIGQKQRIDHVVLMLYQSGGGKIGQDQNSLEDILYRNVDARMDCPQALFSGNKKVLFNGATSVEEQSVQILIENDGPLPMNILAIVPSYNV